MSLHKAVHEVLKHSPDPVTGTAAGATGGAIVGTAASISAANAAGVTVGTFTTLSGTFGTSAAVHILGTVAVSAAAPVFVPAVTCCATVGAVAGTFNYVTSGKMFEHVGEVSKWLSGR